MPSFADLLMTLDSVCALEIPPGKHCSLLNFYLFEFNFANISDPVFIARSQVCVCRLAAVSKLI